MTRSHRRLVVLVWRGNRTRCQSASKAEGRRVEAVSIEPGQLGDPAELQAVRSTFVGDVQLQIMRFSNGIGISAVVESRIVLHLKLGVRFRLKLRNERRTEAQGGRIQAFRRRVLILAPAARTEDGIHYPSRGRSVGRADHDLVSRDSRR